MCEVEEEEDGLDDMEVEAVTGVVEGKIEDVERTEERIDEAEREDADDVDGVRL